MIQGGHGHRAGGNINPQGTSHVRADRRQRAEVHQSKRHQPARGGLRGAMMMDFLGEPRWPTPSRARSSRCTGETKTLAAGKMGYGTKEVGDLCGRGLSETPLKQYQRLVIFRL